MFYRLCWSIGVGGRGTSRQARECHLGSTFFAGQHGRVSQCMGRNKCTRSVIDAVVRRVTRMYRRCTDTTDIHTRARTHSRVHTNARAHSYTPYTHARLPERSHVTHAFVHQRTRTRTGRVDMFPQHFDGAHHHPSPHGKPKLGRSPHGGDQ